MKTNVSLVLTSSWVYFWILPPPGFPIQSIPVCSTWPQGTGLVGEGFGEVQGGEGVGAAGLFTAPHLIVHLAKYIWSNSPQIVH